MPDIFKDEPKPRATAAGGNAWMAVAAVLLVALLVFGKRDNGPSPEPGPQPSGKLTHVLAIGGPVASVKSTKVSKFCDGAGIEYRSLSSGNRPLESEPEILQLYDEGNPKAPRLMFRHEDGGVSDSPVPASADELIVYIQGAND